MFVHKEQFAESEVFMLSSEIPNMLQQTEIYMKLFLNATC